MDIARPDQARKKRIRRLLWGGFGLAAVILLTVGLSRLEPAAPAVDRQTVFTDRVERGEMLRRVRGPGTLVPVETRVIAAATDGQVEEIRMLPGDAVEPGSVILVLSNPQVRQDLVEAEAALRAAEADYLGAEAELESLVLAQQSAAAAIESEHQQALLRAEADQRLAEQGLISDIELKVSKVRADELAERSELERRRVEKTHQLAEAQLAAERARLHQARTLHGLRQELAGSLAVHAGIHGVLQQVDVEVGQRFGPGAPLARVAKPERLKAELRIPETQAKDVQVGQPVEVDTRNGVVAGRVARIDPAVQNGTVTVDVALEGPLPRGARPDLSVDGTIEIERLVDVLYVGRPAYGQAESTITLFRLDADGETARRVPVRLGRTSVTTVEILEGLAEGDVVILSDSSAWDGYDRIRLQ